MLSTLTRSEYGWLFFLIILFFIQPWVSYLSSQERRLVEQILNSEKRDDNRNDSFDIRSTLVKLNQNSHLFFQASLSCRVRYRGHRFEFIDGSVGYISSSWFGARRGEDPVRCLIATSRQAMEVLSSNSRLFRKLAECDDVAVFYIRRLSEFAKEIQG